MGNLQYLAGSKVQLEAGILHQIVTPSEVSNDQKTYYTHDQSVRLVRTVGIIQKLTPLYTSAHASRASAHDNPEPNTLPMGLSFLETDEFRDYVSTTGNTYSFSSRVSAICWLFLSVEADQLLPSEEMP